MMLLINMYRSTKIICDPTCILLQLFLNHLHNMNTTDYLHLLVPVLLVSLIFTPLEYIKWILPIPCLFYLLWVVYRGCPMTKHTETGQHGFICNLLQKIDPTITPVVSEHWVGLVMTSIITILSYRLIYHYDLKQR